MLDWAADRAGPSKARREEALASSASSNDGIHLLFYCPSWRKKTIPQLYQPILPISHTHIHTLTPCFIALMNFSWSATANTSSGTQRVDVEGCRTPMRFWRQMRKIEQHSNISPGEMRKKSEAAEQSSYWKGNFSFNMMISSQ